MMALAIDSSRSSDQLLRVKQSADFSDIMYEYPSLGNDTMLLFPLAGPELYRYASDL